MSFRNFLVEFSKGFPFPVYLLSSSEPFLLHEALSMLRGHHGDDVFNFEVFDMASPDSRVTVEQIIDSLNTPPLMSSSRTVVIRDVQKLSKKDSEKLEAYCAHPAPSCLLIMLYEGGTPKVFTTLSAKEVKTISLNIKEPDIPSWLKDRANRKGITITDRALSSLMSLVGTDLGMLCSEIEKFASSGKDLIDSDDVKELVYAGIEYTAFDLTDALMKRDKSEVFRIYEHMSRSIEAQVLLGALNWQYQNFFARRLRETQQKQDEERYFKILRLLHEADIALKTSHSCAMEELLAKLVLIS